MNISTEEFIKGTTSELFRILKELCEIPAPSHHEHKRAEYCKKWLENAGAQGVYIDEALNVVFPLNCNGSNEITVFAAHTDTVFPDMEAMPYVDDGQRIHSPGVADDTASVVVLLLMAKFFIENDIVPEKGILFVCNSCEEGLGNLKGTRQLFKDYEKRISKFITFDNELDVIADHCVGSCRYEVEVLTEGGHSLEDFGNDNAIAILSEIIKKIYEIEVPEKNGKKTTYNVGMISGGTSVNTIAQNAKMLCEYRSNDKDCLEKMQAEFDKIFNSVRSDKVKVNVTTVGERPCENIDFSKVQKLKDIAAEIIEGVINKKVTCISMSTDCNIPLSMGIPALCVGVNTHAGVHTREEWVEKNSIIKGLEIAIKLGQALMEV